METLPTLKSPVSSKEEVISIGEYEELLDLGLDLNTYYILRLADKGADISLNITSSRIEAWKQTLIRKGYLTDKSEISLTGKELLKAMEDGYKYKPIKKAQKLAADTEFDLWWAAYPPTDTFEFKGMKFVGSRALKVKKEECRVKFNNILNEGDHKGEDMIRALKFEVLQKKSLSTVTKQNKMSYFQNSGTYLYQRSYEPFIALSKDEEAIKEVSKLASIPFTNKDVDI